MTADAVNLLAEIRRLGGDVKLVSCDKLKLVAPSALMPELIKRVRVAKPMLLAVLSNDSTPARREGEGGGISLERPCNSATLTGWVFTGTGHLRTGCRMARPPS
jgi:hypothetical protein